MTGLLPFVKDVIDGAVKLVFGNGATGNENFTDMVYRNSVTDVIVAIIMLVLWLLLLLLVGKYVFNTVLVKVLPVVKPVSSVWELFLLTVLFNILF